MRQCMHKVLDLIKAKSKLIWVNTYEEEALIRDIKEVSTKLRLPMPVYSYSFSSGLKQHKLVAEKDSDRQYQMNVDNLFKTIYDATRGIEKDEEELEMIREMGGVVLDHASNIFVLKDFHLMIDTPNIKRMIRDIAEGKYVNHNIIIVTAPYTEIPVELEKLFNVVDYDTPDENEIAGIINAALATAKNSNPDADVSDSELKAIVSSCKGLTFEEIAFICRLSLVKHRTISLDEINSFKIELIKKSNILDYKIPNASLSEIGGNIAFKNWVEEVMDAMSPEAAAFGCEKPKGYLALGIPGSAKTLLAEALASSMGIPFLKLDMSKILNSKVGGSERNMSQAIRMIKSTAPCLLLIDEVEKTLSGMGSSNNSDAGTMARAIGSILEFLAEDHGVFVVMTSNDASQLPPELTRAGRMDAIWYFGLPEQDERKEIFKIHFSKLNKEVNDDLLEYAAGVANNFTGAEIKEVVKNTVRKAYSRYKQDGNKDILRIDIQKACAEIIPVAESSREKIAALEDYAKTRARFSNVLLNEFKCNVKSDEILKKKLLSVKDLR